MFRFILKAFLRDKNRSLIPIIVVSIGVFLTVAMIGFIRGTLGDMIDMTANFQTGHLRVTTRAYAENIDQMPNDLCLLEVEALKSDLSKRFPDYFWEERILFGGLLDISDADGNTLGQGPASVMGLDFSVDSREIKRLNIAKSIDSGDLPRNKGDVLLGYKFAERLGAEVGDTINFMGSTMYGSMSFALYRVSGTVRFGNAGMDKSTVLMGLEDAKQVMDMADGASSLFGYRKDNVFMDGETVAMSEEFNATLASDNDEFLPTILPLRSQGGMDVMLNHVNSFSSGIIFVFILVMAIVLWNTGLVAGLRRYQEFGIRLAVGERKGHIYRSQVVEAVVVGSIGSFIGTALGLALVFYLQNNGVDISHMMPENAGMMMPSIMRAIASPDLFYIGFIPGVFATVIGALLSGRAIYKRQTSRLMKEMEI